MSSETARKYEAAWNQIFHAQKEYKQQLIIDEPHGRHAGEIAALAAKLAEKGELIGHEKNNMVGPMKFEMPHSGQL